MAIGNFPILIPDFMKTGVPPDPSKFVPQGDPFAELTALLNNLGNRPAVAPPQQGTLQTILTALARGGAVLGSQDPGGTLGGILQGDQKRTDDFAKLNAEIQNNLMMAKIQSAIEKARSISAEQTQARQEQRQNIYEKDKEKRELAKYGKEKEIDLATEEQKFRTNQKLLAEYEPAMMARELNKAYIQDWPQQRKDSVEWQAMAKTVMPNLNPEVAATIGDKLSKLNREPLTVEENDLVKKVNQAFSKQFEEERKAKIGKIKAETFREIQEGLYTQRDKPGASTFQNQFGNAFNRTLGTELANSIDDTYYKLPNPDGTFRMLSLNELKQTDMLKDKSVLNAVPASPEENLAEMQKRVQKLKTFKAQQETDLQQQQQLPSTQPQQKSDADVQQAIRYYQSQSYTPEQMKQALKLSGATDEQINRLLNQKAAPTSTPTTRPRQIIQPTPEEQKMIDRLMKDLQKQRRK